MENIQVTEHYRLRANMSTFCEIIKNCSWLRAQCTGKEKYDRERGLGVTVSLKALN
jgi:hypothetical protein